ncbi:MAG TPA: hypothetical protein VGC87_23370 [Pyrinomonadaceae bacterium]|jgi:hypothetical protein
MRQQKDHKTIFAIATAALISLALSAVSAVSCEAQTPQATPQVSARHKQAIATFEQRVKEYVALREGLEDKLPKLAEDSKPEQIEAHKVSFQNTVRTARAGAKQGDLFVPEIAAYIRLTIADEFKGRERQELRKKVLVEADTKAVALRVNYPYPESEELLDMPPTLLLRLPQLPKQVKYRLVGKNLLLVDRENGLIVDYMLNAVP